MAKGWGGFISQKAAAKLLTNDDRLRRLQQPVKHLLLHMPPSANRYWRVGKQGRLYVSDEAQAYKDDAAMLARSQGLKEPLEGDVAISCRFFRARRSGDLDNRLKVLIDALKGVAYHDDKQITEIHAYRFDDAKNPRVEIEIAEN